MKKLFLTLICLFVSFHPLNGQTNKWTEVYKHTNGDIEYIDFENIRQIGDYIYWYNLTSYIQPRKNIMSLSTYFKGDCEEMKFKYALPGLAGGIVIAHCLNLVQSAFIIVYRSKGGREKLYIQCASLLYPK